MYNETVAIILAEQGIIAPREWMHNDIIRTTSN